MPIPARYQILADLFATYAERLKNEN